jgi:hypothetical protein
MDLKEIWREGRLDWVEVTNDRVKWLSRQWLGTYNSCSDIGQFVIVSTTLPGEWDKVQSLSI